MGPVALLQHQEGGETFAQLVELLERWGVELLALRVDLGELPAPGDRASALVLGGSDLSVPEVRSEGWARRELALLRATELPVLGICFGHQLLAEAFGGLVARRPGGAAEGPEDVDVLRPHPALEGLPRRLRVYEWHEDEVARAPRGFDVLARSASCAVEAMAHRSRTVVGVQFHPEAWRLMGSRGEGNEHGEQLLGNFLRLAGARER